jgi:hypothetical protein
LRIGSLEKLPGGFLGLTDLVGHAAAKVKDDANGNRNVFGRKILDLLLDIVFEDAEIIGLQACDHAVIWISDRNVDQCQVDIDMNGCPGVNDLVRSVPFHVVNRDGLSGQ